MKLVIVGIVPVVALGLAASADYLIVDIQESGPDGVHINIVPVSAPVSFTV